MKARITGSALTTVALVSLTLAGCGGERAPKVAVHSAVYTDSVDCIETARVAADDCTQAIAQAVAAHEAKAATYRDFGPCEAAEGKDRCERTEDDRWRARPLAFLFTIAEGRPSTAVVLYSGPKGTPQYRTSDGKTYNPDDPGKVVFTAAAERRAASFGTTKIQRKG